MYLLKVVSESITYELSARKQKTFYGLLSEKILYKLIPTKNENLYINKNKI